MAHSIIELKRKAIKKVEVPKGSWVDNNGKRWNKVMFDVMVDNGRHFLRQVCVTLGMHFDFGLASYCFDLELGRPMADEILRQYPSLASLKGATFVVTDNKVI